ncbi:MAG: hypothetical protein DWQ18_04395 [Crenarchaeota archaeon]|nr:MAG: hypothetical protein DWQ17_08735 [Thermoproteota archaeon]RDJ34143.1 MAG: hypothetical protein DWQ18_04395 [Thermoproteota archaeon]RDJ36741.1 MAG: hypothetical protein DWQ13_06215 [Thermoproteota archaeon]RDJ37725.1 MAG: hypothetical protein DWQ19_04620 [Thermoproteota archaeon]
MENYTDEEFMVSECIKCKKINWPSLKFCKNCLSSNTLRKGNNIGRIIEYSKNDQGYFGIVEFEGQIRLICYFNQINNPKINQEVILQKIKKNKSNYSFEVSQHY